MTTETETVDYSWQIAKVESWHWGLMIDNQRVTWAAFAMLLLVLYLQSKDCQYEKFGDYSLFVQWQMLKLFHQNKCSFMPLCFKPEIIYSVFNKKVSLANISLKLTVKGPLIGFFHRGELNITGKNISHLWELWPAEPALEIMKKPLKILLGSFQQDLRCAFSILSQHCCWLTVF